MARTALPATTLAPNSAIVAPAGTAIDQANGMNVAVVTTAIPTAPNTQQMVLFVVNTVAAAKNVVIRAGASTYNTPAFRAAIGDLTVTVGASGSAYIGPFESARFAQADGSLNIDFGAAMTGTITAFLVPQRF